MIQPSPLGLEVRSTLRDGWRKTGVRYEARAPEPGARGSCSGRGIEVRSIAGGQAAGVLAWTQSHHMLSAEGAMFNRCVEV